MDYKKLLNEHQYEAVTTSNQFVRIIAGAGSGKTRVLTYRIAYLLSELQVPAWKILAITFTNKVAAEMKERAAQIVPDASADLKISTFHSFCARFLRQEILLLGYPSHFTILDDDDQKQLVKTIAVSEGYQRSNEIVELTLNYIGYNKMQGRYPDDMSLGKMEVYPQEKECLRLWHIYETRMREMLTLDFDDLLLKTIHILDQYPEVRTRWQKKIDHILIDEFQDTNDVQYRLVKLLMRPSTCLYVVGDPDQTIYTWRGANQNIILDLTEEYPVDTIILDRNYRSTSKILDTANKLIDHNRKRVKKNLYTENGPGSDIVKYRGYTMDEEADFVMREITSLARTPGFSYRDVAVLYRSSYLTLPFEKAFMARHIPYVIFGGLRFYQRKEIKDVLAYFRLLINGKDDISFERIINIPKRGIGERSVELIKSEAKKSEYSLLEYFQYLDKDKTAIKPRMLDALLKMKETIIKYRERLEGNVEAYSEVLKDFIVDLNYFEYLKEEENGDERIENVRALFQDVHDFLKRNPESNFNTYMENVALTSAQDEMNDGNYVSLMTIHTAKGLEFKYVFVVGVNEGVFPSARTLEENAYLGLEEERRLCYVAFTRAREKLYVTCNTDYSFILSSRKQPSRFFKEAGIDFERTPRRYGIDEDAPGFVQKRSDVVFDDVPRQNATFHAGDHVLHKNFGEGIVLSVVDNTIIDVEFPEVGRKKLMANHPSITKLTSESDLS